MRSYFGNGLKDLLGAILGWSLAACLISVCLTGTLVTMCQLPWITVDHWTMPVSYALLAVVELIGIVGITAGALETLPRLFRDWISEAKADMSSRRHRELQARIDSSPKWYQNVPVYQKWEPLE